MLPGCYGGAAEAMQPSIVELWTFRIGRCPTPDVTAFCPDRFLGGSGIMAQVIATVAALAFVLSLAACIYPFPPFRSRKYAVMVAVGMLVLASVGAPKQRTHIEPLPPVVVAQSTWKQVIDVSRPPAVQVPGTAPTSGREGRAEQAAVKEVLIPRSSAGDRGQYCLISATTTASGVIKALHKRVGIDSVGWTRTEINCGARLIRDIGYSKKVTDHIRSEPSKWYGLVPGSSKSDLAVFVCR
jgi:hypothetical protein